MNTLYLITSHDDLVHVPLGLVLFQSLSKKNTKMRTINYGKLTIAPSRAWKNNNLPRPLRKLYQTDDDGPAGDGRTDRLIGKFHYQ